MVDHIELISRITDEVKGLHPILISLFSKMEKITSFEYTHGTDEMGADFVLESIHPVLGNSYYIGVIVKIGKIKSNFTEVERQIDECRVRRFFNNGKKEVQISEIWVLCNSTITAAAKRKIYEKFTNTNIQFIDGRTLKGLVEKYLPHYRHDLPAVIGEYLENLSKENDLNEQRFKLLPTCANEFYIEPDVFESEDPRYVTKRKPSKPKRRDVFETALKDKVVILEGSMGTGKSRLFRQIVRNCGSAPSYVKNKTLIVPCTFLDLNASYNLEIKELLQDRVGSKTLEAHGPKNYLILIDGLDEVDMSASELEQALSRFINFTKNNKQYCIVVSTRYLGSAYESVSLSGYTRLELQPLTAKKTTEFIKALCTKVDVREKVLEDLKKSELFKQLPMSPISAILLARVIEQEADDIPSNLPELYAKYSEIVLGRWDIDKGLKKQKEYNALKNIITDLSGYFITNQLVEVAANEVEKRIESYLNLRNLDINPKDLYRQLVVRSELFYSNSTSRTLRFKHRTFAEFFYASRLASDGPFEITSRAFQNYWTNTFYFALGYKKDCPDQIKSLIGLAPVDEGERWSKMMYIAKYMLAAYSTPYPNIVEGVAELMKEFAKHYIEIINKESESPFRMLPRMHILWIFQSIIRSSFGYEFFRKALPDAADKLLDDPEVTDCQVYSLYFLNTIDFELGGLNAFDKLIEDFGSELPIDISLALNHEVKGLSSTQLSRAQKRREKRLKKSLRGNQLLVDQINAMYDSPISSKMHKKLLGDNST